MLWTNPERPGRRVRVGYCLNVHPAETLEELERGLATLTAPLRERLAPDAPFGVGMYFAAPVAFALERDAGARAALRDRLERGGFDPFTANAFPFGGFHADGLKRGVFAPTWMDDERLAFTLAVARVLADLQGDRPAPRLSVSTHCGRYGAFDDASFAAAARNWNRAARALEQLERDTGHRVVLSFEPEPRSAAGDTREWDALAARFLDGCDDGERERARRYLGVCLDACHAAVEFEEPREAWARAGAHGLPFGKLQFSSALRLARPGDHADARDALFALDEPRYLHQATARAADGSLARVEDLPDLARAVAADDAAWTQAAEWRCHFHVPVDLAGLDGLALETTAPFADALLDVALGDDARWQDGELAVELETYTWDVLPGAARGAGDRVDGLAREYAHLGARLAAAGWVQADAGAGR